MQFGELKVNDTVFVLYSNNTLESEKIESISSHNGMIHMNLADPKISVKAEPAKSIYFDEKADVVLFTKKHNLIQDE